jgi:hypothetical protein
MYNLDCNYKASTRSSLKVYGVCNDSATLYTCNHSNSQSFLREWRITETYSQCTYRYSISYAHVPLAYECAKEELVAHILGDHQNHRRISMYSWRLHSDLSVESSSRQSHIRCNEKLKPFSCSVEDCGHTHHQSSIRKNIDTIHLLIASSLVPIQNVTQFSSKKCGRPFR